MIQTKFQGQILPLNKDKHLLTYSLNDFYKVYKKEREGLPHLSRKDYVTALKKIFKSIAETIVYEQIPYNPKVGLGRIGVIKRKSRRKRVDFQKTKELGKTVYHTNAHTGGYHFEYFWEKYGSKCRFRNKRYYKFRPVKSVRRMLPKYIKELANDPYRQGYDCLSQLPLYEQA